MGASILSPRVGAPSFSDMTAEQYFEATSSTIIRRIAALSTRILTILDESSPQFFDYCEDESIHVQNQIEQAIRLEMNGLIEELEKGKT